MRLSVIGTGYLGATHAACMADLGHDVVGIDSDPAKVAMLNRGEVPFWEPGLDEVLQRGIASGRLTFATDPAAASECDVHFVCVGTPQQPGSPAADLTQVASAFDALLPHLRPGSLVVGKSTVPVGTAAALADRVSPTGAHLAWNPEFLREGHAVDDTLRPDRLVFGVRRPEDANTLRQVYADLGFGGGCLPKDIRAFMARAGELGVDEALMFLRDIDDINIRRRQHTVDLAGEVLGGEVRGRRIAAWGAAFKPDSDDVRDSPALHVAAALHGAGADVVVHDPQAMGNAQRLFPDLAFADSAAEAAREADLVLLLTEWRDYVALDPVELGGVMRARNIIDARNALDPSRWRAAGWSYRALGRPTA